MHCSTYEYTGLRHTMHVTHCTACPPAHSQSRAICSNYFSVRAQLRLVCRCKKGPVMPNSSIFTRLDGTSLCTRNCPPYYYNSTCFYKFVSESPQIPCHRPNHWKTHWLNFNQNVVSSLTTHHLNASSLTLRAVWVTDHLSVSNEGIQWHVRVTGKCLCETNTCQTAQICLSLSYSLLVACRSVKQTPVIIVILTSIFTFHDRTCR
jgi:hypothetical protein